MLETHSARRGEFRTTEGRMTQGKPTYLWAAEQVLRRQGRPMRAHEIVHHAQLEGLFSENMQSRTPQKSMQARLSLDILRKGDESTFVRTARGLFYLREYLGAEPAGCSTALIPTVAHDAYT